MIFWENCQRFSRDVEGNVVLAFSLAFPVLLGAAGLAVDSAGFYNQQSRMQSVADSTALAVAKELHLFLEDPQTLKAAGEDRAETLLAETGLAGRAHTTDVTLDPNQGFARVSKYGDARVSATGSLGRKPHCSDRGGPHLWSGPPMHSRA